MSVPESEVAAFLRAFKRIVASARGLDLIPRAETNQTIIDLGLTEKNVVSEILGLSVADYSEGALRDRDRPGHVWVFGREIYGREIYIKLKIAPVGATQIAKCISFHEANYPLRYPYRPKP